MRNGTDRENVSIYFYWYGDARIVTAAFALRPDVATLHAAGGGAGHGEGSWDAILQSVLTGVCPASEAALQWGVKGSCVPKLTGLSIAGGI